MFSTFKIPGSRLKKRRTVRAVNALDSDWNGKIRIPRKVWQEPRENHDFPALFLTRVGFGAGFSKNAENQHVEQTACFDNKNSQKQRKRLEII